MIDCVEDILLSESGAVGTTAAAIGADTDEKGEAPAPLVALT